MAGYNQLKASIASVIKTNNAREITGQLLQNVLNQMVGVIGENLQLAGFADPTSNPGQPDQNIFYIAEQEGVYSHFNNTVLEGGLSFLMWKDGNWSSHTMQVVTEEYIKNHYVSIDFFRSIFRVYDENGNEILPNNEPDPILGTQEVIDNIKAQVGLWTEYYLSALGRATGGGGGGGGGATSLDQLSDVTIIGTPSNGQALVYNSVTQMWENKTIQAGMDMTTVWSELAGNGAQQINISHLTGALADYATQAWVNQNFITVAYFDRLFRAYNGSTLVSHNDTTSTIDNIKAMFGFWTDLYISALGRNSAATGLGIDNLTDVTITTPTDGQVLQYNATSSKWENATIQTVVALSGLTDVLLTTPANNQFLMYDSSEGKWVNMAIKTINSQSLIGTGDISVGGGESGNYLPLSGGTLSNPNWRSQLTINRASDRDSVVAFTNSNGMLGCLGFDGTSGLPCYWAGTSGTGIPLASCEWSDGRYLPLTGGILTGTLNITNSGRFHVGDYAIFRVYEVSADVNYIDIAVTSGNSSHIYDRPLVLMNGFGNIGVGTAEPSYKLHVSGDGYFSGPLKIQELLIGYGNEINCYGAYANIHLNYRVSGYITLCNGGGSVAIGTDLPYYKLYVAGDIYATGAITALSDMREKMAMKNVEMDINKIANAPAFTYYWKNNKDDHDLHVGSSAQYWKDVLPEVVLTAKDEKGTLSMQYGVAALVSAITIARKVVDHEHRIKQLEKENEELKKQLNAA